MQINLLQQFARIKCHFLDADTLVCLLTSYWHVSKETVKCWDKMIGLEWYFWTYTRVTYVSVLTVLSVYISVHMYISEVFLTNSSTAGVRIPLKGTVIFQVYFSVLRGLPEGLCMRDWLGQESWCLTRVFPISSPAVTDSSFVTQTVENFTLWHLMGLFSDIKLCWDFLGNHTHMHRHTHRRW